MRTGFSTRPDKLFDVANSLRSLPAGVCIELLMSRRSGRALSVQRNQLSSAAARWYASIDLLLPDARLAIVTVRRSAAANLAGFVYRVPAILDGAAIGFRFLNVTWDGIAHDDHSVASAGLGVILPAGAGRGIGTRGGRAASDSLTRSRMGAPNFSGIAMCARN
jgi:hypothetical protein